MIEIIVQKSNDPKYQDILFDKAVKKWKKIIEKEGIVQQIKDTRYYQKPSELRRSKQREIEREREHRKNGN